MAFRNPLFEKLLPEKKTSIVLDAAFLNTAFFSAVSYSRSGDVSLQRNSFAPKDSTLFGVRVTSTNSDEQHDKHWLSPLTRKQCPL